PTGISNKGVEKQLRLIITATGLSTPCDKNGRLPLVLSRRRALHKYTGIGPGIPHSVRNDKRQRVSLSFRAPRGIPASTEACVGQLCKALHRGRLQRGQQAVEKSFFNRLRGFRSHPRARQLSCARAYC